MHTKYIVRLPVELGFLSFAVENKHIESTCHIMNMMTTWNYECCLYIAKNMSHIESEGLALDAAMEKKEYDPKDTVDLLYNLHTRCPRCGNPCFIRFSLRKQQQIMTEENPDTYFFATCDIRCDACYSHSSQIQSSSDSHSSSSTQSR